MSSLPQSMDAKVSLKVKALLFGIFDSCFHVYSHSDLPQQSRTSNLVISVSTVLLVLHPTITAVAGEQSQKNVRSCLALWVGKIQKGVSIDASARNITGLAFKHFALPQTQRQTVRLQVCFCLFVSLFRSPPFSSSSKFLLPLLSVCQCAVTVCCAPLPCFV